MTETFRCITLKNVKMPVLRCIQNQIKSISFWGDPETAKRCETCPCDQGIKIREEREMGRSNNKPGVCVNCGRLKVLMGQTGLCGTCYHAQQNKHGDARREALQAIKEKIHSPGFRQYASPKVGQVDGVRVESGWVKASAEAHERREKEVDKVPNVHLAEETSPPGPSEPIGYANIVLRIESDRDRILFEAIGESAKKYRRTPEQQIMYILERLFAGEDKGAAA